MKAIVLREFGGAEVLRLEDVPSPVPGAGELVFRVHAVSVNRTLDLATRAGEYDPFVKLPHILGVDPSGVVTAVGEGVSDRKVGDRVVAIPWRAGPGPLQSVGRQRPGGYAELVSIPAAATVLVPETLDFAVATVVARHAPQAFSLLRDRARLQPGEWVLVMGAAGGLGSVGIQIARLLGARVIAAAGAPARVQAGLDLGAEVGVDYRRQPLAEAVLAATDGRGVDVVFDNLGDPELFPQEIAALARHGRLVTAGSHGGPGEVRLDVKRLYLYQLSILGGLGFSNDDVAASLQAAADGKLIALIDAILPLEAAADAHRRVAARGGLGKVILSPVLQA